MAKRGRPPKYGMQSGAKLIEMIEAFHTYTYERANGTKYIGAIGAVIDQFKAIDRKWPISPTGVKRLISQACSKEQGTQLRVTKYCDLVTRVEVTTVGFESLPSYETLYAKKTCARNCNLLASEF